MNPTLPADALRGQRLIIPNLQPAFASWKQGVNPLYDRAKHAVDESLEGLIEDERVLVKLKAADLGLFAAGYLTSCHHIDKCFTDLGRRLFPNAPYETLETVAFYSVWLFLWDDAIDGADLSGGGLAAEEYCQQSVAFVRHSLGLDGPGAGVPKAPTKVCEGFAEVGRRVGECCGIDERKVLFGHLREYMEACVTEYRWRQSGKAPTVDEFYSWRLGTSSVDAMLDLCRLLSPACYQWERGLTDDRMLNRIDVPRDILESKELRAMGLSVNKLLISWDFHCLDQKPCLPADWGFHRINELFSLRKELVSGPRTSHRALSRWSRHLPALYIQGFVSYYHRPPQNGQWPVWGGAGSGLRASAPRSRVRPFDPRSVRAFEESPPGFRSRPPPFDPRRELAGELLHFLSFPFSSSFFPVGLFLDIFFEPQPNTNRSAHTERRSTRKSHPDHHAIFGFDSRQRHATHCAGHLQLHSRL